MVAIVGRRENKQKKDQDSELPDYHIRWVLGFYDMKKKPTRKIELPPSPKKRHFWPIFSENISKV